MTNSCLQETRILLLESTSSCGTLLRGIERKDPISEGEEVDFMSKKLLDHLGELVEVCRKLD